MALGSTNVTFPNADVGQDATLAEQHALVIEEFTGMVHGTVERRSVIDGFVTVRPLKGTSTLTNRAVGSSTLQKVVPGVALDGIKSDFGRNSLTVDTLVAARETFPLLDSFMTNIDERAAVAKEQGKTFSKFYDNAFLIQALKTARLTQSSYFGGVNGKPAGHYGGNRKALANAGDVNDPELLYTALTELFVQMENRDVDPTLDDVIVVVTPAVYNALAHSDKLINMNYTTSTGRVLQDAALLKAKGVPVYKSNNLPQGVVAGHHLSNAMNGNAFDGDFTKTVAAVFSPQALQAASVIPLASDVFYDKIYKAWFVDSHASFSVGPDRAEYAAELHLP